MPSGLFRLSETLHIWISLANLIRMWDFTRESCWQNTTYLVIWSSGPYLNLFVNHSTHMFSKVMFIMYTCAWFAHDSQTIYWCLENIVSDQWHLLRGEPMVTTVGSVIILSYIYLREWSPLLLIISTCVLTASTSSKLL